MTIGVGKFIIHYLRLFIWRKLHDGRKKNVSSIYMRLKDHKDTEPAREEGKKAGAKGKGTEERAENKRYRVEIKKITRTHNQ